MANDSVGEKCELSVVLCAHNPRSDYLSRVLNALQTQTFAREKWELLLVDNASDISLSSLFNLSWHPRSRHIVEPTLGIAAARRRGMLEAVADLILFVDDDNVLNRNYLSVAHAVEQGWPLLGTWGSGSIALEFEQQPSKHLEVFFPYLAFRDVKRPHWSNVFPCIGATPVGAGLCVRARVAKAYCDMYERSTIQLKSREGDSLLGHEDFEISYVACRMGLGMGLFPTLKITHLISRWRMTEDYLVRLFEGSRTSNMLLAQKWQGVPVGSPFTVDGILSVLVNYMGRRGLDRRLYFANLRASIKAKRLLVREGARHLQQSMEAKHSGDVSEPDHTSRFKHAPEGFAHAAGTAALDRQALPITEQMIFDLSSAFPTIFKPGVEANRRANTYGIWSDGWCAAQCDLLLSGGDQRMISIAGVVPNVSTGFRAKLVVRVDGQQIGALDLAPGDISATWQIPQSGHPRAVMLKFDAVQALQHPDTRKAAMLIREIAVRPGAESEQHVAPPDETSPRSNAP
jgi:glycosyltransferase involved in cell wall biosynthesis